MYFPQSVFSGITVSHKVQKHMWLTQSSSYNVLGWRVSPTLHIHLESLGENRIFADVIKLRHSHNGSGWALIQWLGVFLRREKFGNKNTHRAKRTMWKWRQSMELYCHKPRTASKHQKLGKRQERILPSSLHREPGPADTLTSDF